MAFGKILSQRNCNVSQARHRIPQIHQQSCRGESEVRPRCIVVSWKDISKVVAVTKPEEQDHLVQFLLGLREEEGREKKLQVEGEATTLSSLLLFGREMRYVWNETLDEKSSQSLSFVQISQPVIPTSLSNQSSPSTVLLPTAVLLCLPAARWCISNAAYIIHIAAACNTTAIVFSAGELSSKALRIDQIQNRE
ncbi:hypothetical protein DL95DRAFT_417070 [Leptodontidium sp. 2 PMI_412]|nr:hypothetical protein DL95DRAFT_417070 [Leptodontidium sp. 2 PMI_412]